MTEELLRKQLLRYCHAIYKKGWVANHDGNLSAKLPDGNLLCTPTAMSKGDIEMEMLLVLDDQNQVISGSRRSFSELHMHRAAYAARPDIGCVIHAHPPTATGFAVANVELGHPFMAEPFVSLGKHIPMVSFYIPKDERLDHEIAQALSRADVLLLANHGVLSVGGSFEQAFLRLELVEHLAKIALVARQLGGPVPLSEEVIATLSSKGRPPSQPNFESENSSAFSPKNVSNRARPNVERLVKEALNKLT